MVGLRHTMPHKQALTNAYFHKFTYEGAKHEWDSLWAPSLGPKSTTTPELPAPAGAHRPRPLEGVPDFFQRKLLSFSAEKFARKKLNGL
jgi:hypothetical protein